MILDAKLLFTGTINGATSTIAADSLNDSPTTGTQVSSNVVDLGITSGIPSSASGGGARDISVGDDPQLKLLALVTTAFVGGTTLQLLLEGGVDNGSGAIGSLTTMWTSFAYTEANLDLGANIGTIAVPRPTPSQAIPRFLKLSFISGGTHTGGAVCAGIVIDRFDQIQGADSKLSGYPPGIAISN